MWRSLQSILMMVAKDKGLKYPEKWVEERLNHCEVHSDYYSFIHLKSNKRMHFGVKDAKFECQPFIIYREMLWTEVKPLTEFEIYTFNTLEDKGFNELLQEAYQSHFDSIKEVRVFFEGTPLAFKIKTDEGYAVLGEYNLMDEGYELQTDLYRLHIKDSNISKYSVHRDIMELEIPKLRAFFTEVSEDVFTSDVVIVSKGDVIIPFELVKADGEWFVHWKD